MVISGKDKQLQRLDEKCYDIMRLAHRLNTRRNKRSQASIYQRFCDTHDLNEMPTDEWQLVRYAVYTAERVTSHGTVANYVGGIRQLQHTAGYDTPAADSPNLRLILQGIKSYLAKPVRQATPITIDMLQQISTKVDFSNQYQVCGYSALLTGFYLILRSSNLVPSSTPNFNPAEQLTRWHVGLDKEDKLAMFLIEWSKTIQHSQREMWVPVMPAKDKDVCLITVLRRYFRLMPAKPTDPLFCYYNSKKQLKALTYDQLDTLLKDWMEEIGQDKQLFSLHGLRRGGTTHAFDMGIKPEYIKMMGDWASQCFYRYIDIALNNRLQAAVKFNR